MARARLCRISPLIANYLASRRVGDAQERALAQIAGHFGHLTPRALNPRHIQQYKRARGASPATQRRELGALVAVLNWAVKTKLLPREDVPHIDLPPQSQPRELFMTEQEAAAFLTAALPIPRVGPFVALALMTGARKAAIRQLTWDRVDLDAGTVDYRVPGAPVTNKRRVSVPINRTLQTILREADNGKGPFVIGQGSIRSNYERFTASISMAWVTPHVLRHTAATIMLRAGVPIWDVAGVLGDAVETVSKTYGHHAAAHLRSAVTALDQSHPNRAGNEQANECVERPGNHGHP